ncbi:MAG: type II secretion system F family protein [Dehalococcoidales bacterium]|nr:type II secretion system F family protein [Dehalococcoidales bacterium]
MDYSYVAYTEENKIINGAIGASTEKAASDYLVKQGYRVLSLKEKKPLSLSLGNFFSMGKKVKQDDIVLFAREMATLIDSGVSVVTALELLQGQATNEKMGSVLNTVISDIRSGQRLSDAMSKHNDVFSPLFCRSLSVGEQSAELSIVLNQIAEYMEKDSVAKKGIKGAMAYPLVISVVAIAVITVLVYGVFPTFLGLYSVLGAEVPLLPRILLGIVDVAKVIMPYLLGALVVGIIGIMVYIRKPSGRYMWDKLSLRFPLLGRIMLLRELSSCCRTMSLLFRCGLPLAEIMDVVIDAGGNTVIKGSLADIKKAVFKGEGLSKPMSRNPYFLPMMVEMVKVGEETGELDKTLMTVANNYDTDADGRTKAMIGIIQPAMTLIIGGVVFFIVVSMFSIMYSIYGQVQF